VAVIQNGLDWCPKLPVATSPYPFAKKKEHPEATPLKLLCFKVTFGLFKFSRTDK
jgi:hypothetical protein